MLAVSLFGSSCSGGSGDTSSVLKIGSTKPFKTTNKFGDYWYGVLTNITTHDSLIKLDNQMNIVPWLATEWDISEDSRTFIFTITQDAKWHDGQPLTAEDIKFSVEYYRDNDPQAGWMQEIIQSVDVDDNRVTLVLSRPYGNLLTEFMTYSMIPKHVWSEVKNPLTYEGPDRIIGSGPYRLVSWDPSAGRFIFEANPEHFMGVPAIKNIEISLYSNMDALVMALSRGDIDTWWDYSGEFPVTHIPALLKAGDIKFASATFLGVPAAIGFNLDRQPTQRLEFRQAVSNAINYQQIVELIYAGYGSVPGSGFLPATHVNYNDTLPELEYNPQLANDLLDELGMVDSNDDGLREEPSGANISLTLLARSDMPSLVRIAEMVSVDLEAVGIGVTIRALDSSTWVAAKDAMEYDLVLFRATPMGYLMHAANASGYFDARRTGSGYCITWIQLIICSYATTGLATAIPAEQAELDWAIPADACQLCCLILPFFCGGGVAGECLSLPADLGRMGD